MSLPIQPATSAVSPKFLSVGHFQCILSVADLEAGKLYRDNLPGVRRDS
jgi:hypothetical protein